MTTSTEVGRAFRVLRSAVYPRLTWLFDASDQPVAYCGDDVEIFEDGLVEGCWDGQFSSFDFPHRVNFFGSGVIRRGDTWLFCPPCHTFEALYVMVQQGRASVSNSVVPLFATWGRAPIRV